MHPGLRVAATTMHTREASTSIASALWIANLSHSDRGRAARYTGRLRPSFVASLHLPLLDEQKPAAQPVALVDGLRFDRRGTSATLAELYAERPRTRLYESIDFHGQDWYSDTAFRLTHLARCRVVCSMYESAARDATSEAHIDQWDGLILQMRGSKRWVLPDQPPVVTQPGDVLVLPRGVHHAVETDAYSVHLVFALVTDEPLRSNALPETS